MTYRGDCMEVVGLTDVGLVREKNQDSFFISKDSSLSLFIIADGMGGHKSGEVASNDAIKIIKKEFLKNKSELVSKEKILKLIERAVQSANKSIYEKSLEEIKYNGMGTTVSLSYIFEDMIIIGHVGDSRIYKFNNNKMKQLTEDHSLVNELVKSGKITKEQAKTHPQKNMITRAVGTSIDIEVDVEAFKYQKSDKLLLATDGLFNMVDETEIEKIINENSSILNSAEKLIDLSKANGGTDNITLVLIEFK